MADKQTRETARQTFRQFAWNLAGTLADKQRPPTPPKSGARKSG